MCKRPLEVRLSGGGRSSRAFLASATPDDVEPTTTRLGAGTPTCATGLAARSCCSCPRSLCCPCLSWRRRPLPRPSVLAGRRGTDDALGGQGRHGQPQGRTWRDGHHPHRQDGQSSGPGVDERLRGAARRPWSASWPPCRCLGWTLPTRHASPERPSAVALNLISGAR